MLKYESFETLTLVSVLASRFGFITPYGAFSAIICESSSPFMYFAVKILFPICVNLCSSVA